jgi:predicted transcriptional regulator
MISNIGPLERKILNILLARHYATARDICTSLEDTGERRAYSTVRTIINRLVQKKIIAQHENEVDRQYYYTPIMTKEEVESSIINRVLGDLLNRFGQSTINYLAEELSDNPEEIDRLKKKLAEMKQNAD